MKIFLPLGLCAILSMLFASCASVPVSLPPTQLLHDELFAPPSARIDADDIFKASDAMKRYLQNDIAAQLRVKGPRQGLIDALNNKHQLKLDYDGAMTRNAAQTFEDRAGNCLSLVIMTAALAREMGMPVQFQSVLVDENWSRSGGIHFTSGHVNLVVGRPHSDFKGSYEDNAHITIDFIEPGANRHRRARPIRRETVSAMFMNNRSAEALADGQFSEAYWWVREAIRQDPDFLSAYNTLGVIYRRNGNTVEAEQAFRYTLAREPANILFMSNLAMVLTDEGRINDAKALMDQVERKRPFAPFHFFNLGTEAMQAGDFKTARDMFTRELARDPYNHEFHFWLAAALTRLGDLPLAKRHLGIAMEFSTTRRERDIYAAKLDRIKAVN